MHVVTEQNALYFCTRKCQRNHGKRQSRWVGRERKHAAQSQSADVAPSTPISGVDWLELPGDIVWKIQEQLSLYDLLSMGMACKSWFSSMTPALQTVDLVAEVDLRRWSHAVYLLQKLFPHINQLSVQLPDASCATEQIQVLSRATQVQHLDLRVHGDDGLAFEHTWFPALGRLTALRSLKLAVPHQTGHHIGGLSLLKHLTTLQVMPTADDGSQVFLHEPKHEAIESLAALTAIEELEYPDELLPSVEVSSLLSLTSLTITNVDVHYEAHDFGDSADTYALEHMAALSRLPCLFRLCLRTMPATKACWYQNKTGGEFAARSSAFLDACGRHLDQIPELELHITPLMRLEACSANLGHLARLTNLTALHVAFADCTPDTRLGQLRTLSQLRRLCISTAGFGEVPQRSNEVCIFGQEVRGLCRAMQQLTCLKLALRPAWFDSIRSLQHLAALPALQELTLCRPPDAYPGKDVETVASIPASYIPTSVVRLELEGYAVLPEPKAVAAGPAAC